MVKRSYSLDKDEPDAKDFKIPSVKEHLFQVVDVFTKDSEYGGKLNLDDDTVAVQCEVVGGEEEGRNLLNRCNLDPQWKGFFATRLFLKAIGEEYKGDISIDTDRWIGRQFYATVVHNEGKNKKVYANIDQYNFDNVVEQVILPSSDNKTAKAEEIAWDS